MAVFDIRSDLKLTSVLIAAITTNTDTNTNSVDNADFENGLMFSFNTVAYTDGTYVVKLQDSDDNSVWADVAANKIIGETGGISITAATALDGVLETIGVFSNRQFVRAVITSTGVTTGAQIIVDAVEMGELLPVAPQ